ncbi:MAG: alpha-ribazole phosphatase family protein [Candidatus Delongbacteria bacterium]|nr:alpha-ribazole phosphatase family protein [Candidatus Delongbacteria bacterium]MBN2835034.1 alpha-ribazole phosphatase family protein [Candidatus Delongbacteria bacterium]
MAIYLIRHTKVDCEGSICYGRSDFELKKGYESEFKLIKDLLPDNLIAYSSPLKRCKLLADYITDNYEIVGNLIEIDFGKWEGLSWNQIPLEEINIWSSDYVKNKPPMGESFVTLHRRATKFFKSIEGENENICLITHAGVIRSLLSYTLHVPLKHIFSLKLNYGTIIKIDTIVDNIYNIEFIKL